MKNSIKVKVYVCKTKKKLRQKYDSISKGRVGGEIKEYLGYKINIPIKIATDFGLKNNQELNIFPDYVSKKIILSIGNLDIQTHEEWRARLLKEDKRRFPKTKKKKIELTEKMKIEREIELINLGIKTNQQIINSDKELLKLKKEELKKLKV